MDVPTSFVSISSKEAINQAFKLHTNSYSGKEDENVDFLIREVEVSHKSGMIGTENQHFAIAINYLTGE